jgi:hypothetical protein
MKYWNEVTAAIWFIGGGIAFGNGIIFTGGLGALWMMWATISFLAGGYYLSARPIGIE